MEANQRRIEGGYVLFARAYLELLAELPVLDRALWVWLLCKANHRDSNTGLRRGQLVTTSKQMANALGYSSGYTYRKPAKQALWKSLGRLRGRDLIETRKTTRGLVITICHYELYQQPGNYGRDHGGRMGVTTEVTDVLHDRQELKNVKKKKETERVVPPAFSSKSFYQMDCDKADTALAESAERFLNDEQE
jgi:hypothetical protein